MPLLNDSLRAILNHSFISDLMNKRTTQTLPFCQQRIEQFFYNCLYKIKHKGGADDYNLRRNQVLINSSMVLGLISHISCVFLLLIGIRSGLFRLSHFFFRNRKNVQRLSVNTITIGVLTGGVFWVAYKGSYYSELGLIILAGLCLVIAVCKKIWKQYRLKNEMIKYRIFSITIPFMLSIFMLIIHVLSMKSYIQYNRIFCFYVYDTIRIMEPGFFADYFYP